MNALDRYRRIHDEEGSHSAEDVDTQTVKERWKREGALIEALDQLITTSKILSHWEGSDLQSIINSTLEEGLK